MKKIGILALITILGSMLVSISLVSTVRATVPGDLNGDGHVTLADLSQMVLWYGMTSSNPNWDVSSPPWVTPHTADYNGNGKIDLVDLVTEAMYYSISPPLD